LQVHQIHCERFHFGDVGRPPVMTRVEIAKNKNERARLAAKNGSCAPARTGLGGRNREKPDEPPPPESDILPLPSL
jgi:hypothetical protein